MYRNIKAEMARYELKARDLAEILDVSIVTVRNKLNGRTPWMLAEAKALMDHFNSKGGKHTIESLFEEAV